jgi:hypothetical protein
MKKLVAQGFDDHPEDDPDRARMSWTVSVLGDREGCEGTRIELVLEDVGRPGAGLNAHFAPATARRLRAELARALREIGETPG